MRPTCAGHAGVQVQWSLASLGETTAAVMIGQSFFRITSPFSSIGANGTCASGRFPVPPLPVLTASYPSLAPSSTDGGRSGVRLARNVTRITQYPSDTIDTCAAWANAFSHFSETAVSCETDRGRRLGHTTCLVQRRIVFWSVSAAEC